MKSDAGEFPDRSHRLINQLLSQHRVTQVFLPSLQHFVGKLVGGMSQNLKQQL